MSNLPPPERPKTYKVTITDRQYGNNWDEHHGVVSIGTGDGLLSIACENGCRYYYDITGRDFVAEPERYPSVTKEPQVPDCAQCATYQHDVSYHDDERYPSVTDEP